MHIRSNSAPTTPAQAVPPSLNARDDPSNVEARYQLEHPGHQGSTSRYDTRRSGPNQDIAQPWLLWQNPTSAGNNSGMGRGKFEYFITPSSIAACSPSCCAIGDLNDKQSSHDFEESYNLMQGRLRSPSSDTTSSKKGRRIADIFQEVEKFSIYHPLMLSS